MIPVHDLVRYMDGYSSWPVGKTCRRPVLQSFKIRNYLIQHSSGFRVESGRLGEVESLVGDCRPPPPDNPHQLITRSSINCISGELWKNPFPCDGFIEFIPKWQKNGGVSLSMCRHHSFKNIEYPYNLKKLIQSQYFKNDCSYFSCVEKCTVLEFVSSHYHLYGLRLVGLPSIAITNVLIM